MNIFQKTIKEVEDLFKKKGWKKIGEHYSQGEQAFTFHNKKRGLALSVQIYDEEELEENKLSIIRFYDDGVSGQREDISFS